MTVVIKRWWRGAVANGPLMSSPSLYHTSVGLGIALCGTTTGLCALALSWQAKQCLMKSSTWVSRPGSQYVVCNAFLPSRCRDGLHGRCAKYDVVAKLGLPNGDRSLLYTRTR